VQTIGLQRIAIPKIRDNGVLNKRTGKKFLFVSNRKQDISENELKPKRSSTNSGETGLQETELLNFLISEVRGD
jgi:hypothetical protein